MGPAASPGPPNQQLRLLVGRAQELWVGVPCQGWGCEAVAISVAAKRRRRGGDAWNWNLSDSIDLQVNWAGSDECCRQQARQREECGRWIAAFSPGTCLASTLCTNLVCYGRGIASLSNPGAEFFLSNPGADCASRSEAQLRPVCRLASTGGGAIYFSLLKGHGS